MIRVERVEKIYRTGSTKRTALSSLSLTIPDGNIVSILGPSGCGKSTLLRIIAGIEKPTSGTVELNGTGINGGAEKNASGERSFLNVRSLLPSGANYLFRDGPKNDIALVFQDSTVFPWMRVLENLTFVLRLRGADRSSAEKRSSQLLERVGLGDNLHTYPRELSGGMLQRLALAQALVVEPELLLLDEPFASVDSVTRYELQDLLLRIRKDTGSTIILVTHDIEEAVYLSDTVAVLSPPPGTVVGTFNTGHPRPRTRRSPELDHARSVIAEILSGTFLNRESHQAVWYNETDRNLYTT